MSQPILKRDSGREIVLEAPRTGAFALLGFLVAMLFGAMAFFPSRTVAQAVFGLLALWAVAGALRVHRLRLDLAGRTWTYHRGWIFAPPAKRGTFDDLGAVFLERNEVAGGQRLRSRLILLEMRRWPDGDGVFALGFPMGPRVAAERAADYARRLGVPLVDRTAVRDPG